jgi:hypothetical protein
MHSSRMQPTSRLASAAGSTWSPRKRSATAVATGMLVARSPAAHPASPTLRLTPGAQVDSSWAWRDPRRIDCSRYRQSGSVQRSWPDARPDARKEPSAHPNPALLKSRSQRSRRPSSARRKPRSRRSRRSQRLLATYARRSVPGRRRSRAAHSTIVCARVPSCAPLTSAAKSWKASYAALRPTPWSIGSATRTRELRRSRTASATPSRAQSWPAYKLQASAAIGSVPGYPTGHGARRTARPSRARDAALQQRV